MKRALALLLLVALALIALPNTGCCPLLESAATTRRHE